MTTHEVEVKPYGTRNDAGTQSLGSTQHTTVEVKPPYGQRNEAEIRSQPLQQQSYGSRADVEVKPYGTTEHQIPRDTVYKPQQYQYQQTRTTQPLNWENLKNPLLATALGVTLALLLLSLVQVPRTISHWWHGKEHDTSRQYDYPRGWSRDYSRERDYYSRERDWPRERDYRDYGRDASWKAGEMYQAGKDTLYQARDKASQMYDSARDTGESMLHRAKDAVTGGSGGYYGGYGYTEESKGVACRTAERARDLACGRDSYSSSYYGRESPIEYAREKGREAADYARWRGREAADSARYNAREAESMYESAKHRAADMLESAKQTVTYPARAAMDTVAQTRNAAANTLENARENVVYTGERARDATGSTFQAAKDTVRQAAEVVKDTVVGAKDTVLNTASSAAQGVKDTVTGTADRVRDTFSREEYDTAQYEGRGPTKVRVEVQEM